jgi:hypothetical protein
MRSLGRRVVGIGIVIVMSASLVVSASAATTLISAQSDAFVVSTSPRANKGTATSLKVRNATKQTYVRFVVPALPPSTEVTRATLRMYSTTPAKCSLGVQVFRAANDSWGETTINWNNQPSAVGTALAATSWTTRNGYRIFDVSGAVNGAGPVSFVLRHTADCNVSSDVGFSSREVSSTPPQLEIETSSATTAPACSDGTDNDADGLTDLADPGCADANDDDEAEGAKERPNVLIIMTDDQRASSDGLSVMDDLQAIYGGGGTYYPNAVATTPLCCPSRASIMTGRYAHNTGIQHNDGNGLDQTTTLQYHLQQHLGYETALIGKYLNDFIGTPPYFDLVALKTGYGDPSTSSYATTFIRDRAVEFLNAAEQNDSQPWLMYLTPFSPHAPAVPETKYADAPVPAWEDNPARTETDLSDKPAFVLQHQASKTEVQALRINMIRTLYSVDDLIAGVFARLDELGEGNTIAFFLSDNGYQWYEHGLEKKDKPYSDSVRVPFFVRWPGHVAAGAVDGKIVANIDIAPTVYDAIGYSPANYVPDGRSILTSQRQVILTEDWGPTFLSLWTPDWMYAEWGDGFLEYYGPTDPWQLDNGFETGAPPPNAEQLHSQLQSYATCVGNQCP